MGVFDSLKNATSSAVSNAANNINNSAQSKTERFIFSTIPENPEELMILPEASLDSPYKTTALTMLALMEYAKNPENCFAMLNALRGPDPMTEYAKNFIKERLNSKTYKIGSFFYGATVQNNYAEVTFM